MTAIAGPPVGSVEVPALVRGFLQSDEVPEAVWRNLLGGLTFRSGDRYLKWNPWGAPDLEHERARLAWLSGRHPVPRVLDVGRDDSGQVLVTAALDGTGAAVEPWIRRPEVAVPAIAVGLRALHDNLPVEDCAFPSWVGARETPPPTRLVVCHGDPCAPNTVIGPDGGFAGHVDVGQLGVADVWADLAVASMSLDWNYGDGWQAAFFGAYGIDRDEPRIRFYRALWENGDPSTGSRDTAAP